MKKARKIKIKGVEYKYFLDTAGKDELGMPCRSVTLYNADGTTSRWLRVPENIGNVEVKQAILDGKFEK